MKRLKLSLICVFLLLFGYFIHSIIYGMIYPANHYPWSEYTPPPPLLNYVSIFINFMVFCVLVPILSYSGVITFKSKLFQYQINRIIFVILYSGLLYLLFMFLFDLSIVGCD